MSGFSGSGTSTGNGGGFTQSSNAFGGLNNTDLRPGRRRRRPVPLIDSSWPIRRKKETTMLRKDVTGLVETLRTSVLGITTSAADNREELLNKSFGEFDTAMQGWIDDRYGEELEPLAKGLNHISAFAQALNRMNQTVNAIKTGRPSYMIDSDSSQTPEPIVQESVDALDRFMKVGIFTLRSMVNDTAELPEDEADLERAEQAGALIKLDTEQGEILIKTELPDDLREYFADPLVLMMDAADVAREMTYDVMDRAEVMLKLDPDAIPQDVILAYPEIFETPDDDLGKAFPPRKQPQQGAADTERNAGGGGNAGGGSSASAGTGNGGQDEEQGDGGDPNDDALEPGADVTDDTPQNPLEMIARLSSIIVVIAGSLLQGQNGGTDDSATDTAGVGGSSDDARNVGLQRIVPVFDAPLAKILKGEIEVDPTLAEAIEELWERRQAEPALQKQLTDATTELDTLKKTLARLQGQPAPSIGVQRVVAVGKSDDVSGGLAKNSPEALAAEVEQMRKTSPDSAAKMLIAAAHASGGRPLMPST